MRHPKTTVNGMTLYETLPNNTTSDAFARRAAAAFPRACEDVHCIKAGSHRSVAVRLAEGVEADDVTVPTDYRVDGAHTGKSGQEFLWMVMA